MAATNDPRYIEFIVRLRCARHAHGLSQVELARLLTKNQSYVSKVETCERRLDLIEAADWCLALKTPLSDVLPPRLRSSLIPEPQPRRRARP